MKMLGRTTSDFCRELPGVPEGYEMEAVLSIGVADNSAPAPRTLDEAEMSKVHWGSYQKAFALAPLQPITCPVVVKNPSSREFGPHPTWDGARFAYCGGL